MISTAEKYSAQWFKDLDAWLKSLECLKLRVLTAGGILYPTLAEADLPHIQRTGAGGSSTSRLTTGRGKKMEAHSKVPG